MQKLLLFSILLTGCAHRVVRGNPATLPTIERANYIHHLSDESEANQSGDVTISEKGWTLIVFDHPYTKPAACNIRDLSNKKLRLRMSEPDGIVFTGRPGDRIHFACQGTFAPYQPFWPELKHREAGDGR